MMPRIPALLGCALAVIALADPAAAQRRGSIYDARRGPIAPLADKTAHRIGDLVTVRIQENQDVKNEEKTDLTKASDLNYQLLNFDVKPDAFATLPELRTSKSDNFAGSSNIEKTGEFEARLTAMVVDRLPNGNLVIEGRREIRIDREIKVIEFSGVVRRYDIRRDNSVESELVANARVTYLGSGPSRDANERRGVASWLYRAVDWIWPF